MNTIADSVGRSIRISFTDGMSMPSLKTLTVKTTSSVSLSASNLAKILSLSGTFISPLTQQLGIPLELNCSDMYFACSTLAQNPKVFLFIPSKP